MSYDAWKTNAPDPGSVEDEPCASCGADPDEPCNWNCDCQHCLNVAERRWAERESHEAAYEREQMARIQRDLK